MVGLWCYKQSSVTRLSLFYLIYVLYIYSCDIKEISRVRIRDGLVKTPFYFTNVRPSGLVLKTI